MTRMRVSPTVRSSYPLFLMVALVLSNPLGCAGSPNKGGGNAGGSGEDTGGSPGSGGSKGTGGKGTGGASDTGGKGGGSGPSGGQGGNGGADTGGSGGGADTGGSGGSQTGGSSGGADAGLKDSGAPAPDAMMGTGMGLTGNGCAGGTCLNPECKPLNGAAAGGKTPNTGFELQPSYIPNDVIVATFDDTPDGINSPPDPNFGAGDWTRKMVDYFDGVGLHMDFFINGNNFCDVAKTPECEETVRRILKNHNPANHTVHHIHMGGNTGAPTGADGSCNGTQCDAEMMGVESLINTLSMGGRPHLTRFRAPYGEPFQAGGGGAIATIVGKYAVHVGWQMDSTDSLCDNCKYTGAQIAKKVTDQIGTGPGKGKAWGIVLMHGTYPWSYDAAKILFDPTTGYIKTHGFRLGTVEDVICWKYGKHSWELIAAANNSQRGPN
jgi:peptidoglycan/xylan/chitin deacetylase (PgdA/CDA1 family)